MSELRGFRYNRRSNTGRGGEMADAADSKSAGATRGGSNPPPGTLEARESQSSARPYIKFPSRANKMSNSAPRFGLFRCYNDM